ncbi:YbhB/YbcL family Raf kinase inhibitor-like protein [Lysobacter sp. KIS68-7]|uniref:YbhB/YbcL family Raf kinase inhibitor-like protein n=1 Tax=Lysobacter sp. KIS68-7 TaxID=2904252 RepID=UPI001E2DB4C7|nr:YbhB/YbcL family Raf kinase inhibitor-like protein [Lysobacter sp. KIS68-7]UHQ20053.1 YbhB/YbcL family Raf kinase inhibitor-like protein [Lysobacter sp. KIS68-7]
MFRKGILLIVCALASSGAWAQGTLTVTSPVFRAGAAIPAKYSAYHENVSPALKWEAVAGAKSYALIVEDPDAPTPTPFVHWVAWNIPATTTSLAEGKGAGRQGRAGTGNAGYFGPRPPVSDGPHHYHFEIYALDTTLDLPPGADRDALLKAAAGHVIAKGELVGTYDEVQAPAKSGG